MIYFSEWGTTSRISSVDIPRDDTSASSVLVLHTASNVTWPNALSLSKDRTKLYFGHAPDGNISSYNLLSSKVSKMAGTPHIFGIDQHTERYHQQYIYWSDWKLGVLKMPVQGKRVQLLASGNDVYRASGIKVFSKH